MRSALGIDVGVRKGLDVVLMDQARRIVEARRGVRVEELGSTLDRTCPDAVAIDSPPAWGLSGNCRSAENQLRALGIHSYGTPSDPARGENAFFTWMREGFRAFQVAGPRGFPRYTDGPIAGTALEVFPHATAVTLAGTLRPPHMGKRGWRMSVLQGRGVRVESLGSIDQIDAALAALTGVLALEGEFTGIGEPEEGVIVVPVRPRPAEPFPRPLAGAGVPARTERGEPG